MASRFLVLGDPDLQPGASAHRPTHYDDADLILRTYVIDTPPAPDSNVLEPLHAVQ